MTRNTSQGTGARHETPRSPVPVPIPASTSEDRLTPLEDALQDVMHTLTSRIESLGREIASVQRVLDTRGQESHEYAKVRELDEPHRNINNLRRRVEARDSEATRTPSHDHERQPIPAYYGKSSAFLTLFFNWVISQNVEAALTSKISVVMTTQKSRNELYDQYVRDIVD